MEATNAAAPADTVSMDQADGKILSNDATLPASGDLISVSFMLLIILTARSLCGGCFVGAWCSFSLPF